MWELSSIYTIDPSRSAYAESCNGACLSQARLFPCLPQFNANCELAPVAFTHVTMVIILVIAHISGFALDPYPRLVGGDADLRTCGQSAVASLLTLIELLCKMSSKHFLQSVVFSTSRFRGSN